MPEPTIATRGDWPSSSAACATSAFRREVRARLKLLMLDSLGCALFGADLEWSRILRRTLAAVDTSHGRHPSGARPSGCRRRTRRWSTARRAGLRARRRASPGRAARRRRHAAGAVRRRREPWPAAFSGRDFLRAAVAGYEVGPRVGMCMGQEHIGQGWHSGATVGVFSAAAGASAALGLNAEQTVHALGIAGTQSAGLMAAQYGAMVKRMHAGPLVAERALRRAACARRLHRHRQRVRERVRRLLHHVLALAATASSSRS